MVVLAAVDERERSKLVVDIAYDIATTYDDDLVALHVMPSEDYEEHVAALEDVPELSGMTFSQGKESARTVANEFVNRTLGDVDTERVEPRGRVGDVPSEILAEAAELDPRFLVISGRRRSPTGKAIFGNTAQRILLNAECPVVSKLTDE